VVERCLIGHVVHDDDAMGLFVAVRRVGVQVYRRARNSRRDSRMFFPRSCNNVV
jgi:hypothetical protein